MNNGQKYLWAARLGMVAMAGLVVTTIISMFHWPTEGDVLRGTNATLSAVLTFVLGVFTGATRPDPDEAKAAIATVAGHSKDGGAESITVATVSGATERPPAS